MTPQPEADRLLFVFLDGVGLGPADPASNPFAAAETPFLRELLGGPLTAERDAASGGEGDARWCFAPLDATLAWDGLPQSATGQTTLLTGRNGADAMEGHYGPWPGPTLRRELESDTLFHRHRPARLANAYPAGFFEALGRRRMRLNAPLYAARAAGVELPDLDAYRERRAIAADLTGAYFSERDPSFETRTPERSAADLVAIAREARFTFFDFWLTDRTGHRGDHADAVRLVERLDAFLGAVWRAAERVTVLVTSDHGNLENSATRSHTRNPVPLLVRGPQTTRFVGARALPDVAPAVDAALAT